MKTKNKITLYNEGLRMVQDKKFTEAIEFFDKSIEVDSKMGDSHHDKAICHMNLRQYESALESVSNAIKIKSKNPNYYFTKGCIYEKLENWNGALISYDEALYLKPNFSKALHNKGNILSLLGNLDDALKLIDESIRLEPKLAEFHYSKGCVLDKLGNLDSAILSYTYAIEYDKNIDSYYFNLANDLLKSKKYQETLKCSKIAIKKFPEERDFYTLQAEAYMGLKKYRNAYKCYNLVIKHSLYTAETYSSKGDCLFFFKKFISAGNCYDEALKIDPKNPNYIFNRAKVFHKLKKYEKAIALYNKAIKNIRDVDNELSEQINLSIEKLKNERKNKISKNTKRKKALIMSESLSSTEKEKEIHLNENLKYRNQLDKNIIFISDEINSNKNQQSDKIIQNTKEILINQSQTIHIIENTFCDCSKNKYLFPDYYTTKVYLTEYDFSDAIVKEIFMKTDKNYEELVLTTLSSITKIKYPNLVICYDFSYTSNNLKMTNEYCKGGSLYDILHGDNKILLSTKQKVKILFDCAKGLYHLHSQKPPIKHQNIHSKNVLIHDAIKDSNSDIFSKISDYGIKNILEKSKNFQMSNILYTAPEYFKEGKYETKSDMFSFGILIWEIFSQKIPFDEIELNQAQILYQLTQNRIRPNLKLLLNDIPGEIIRLMKACWDEDLNIRPDAGYVASSLKNVLNQLNTDINFIFNNF